MAKKKEAVLEFPRPLDNTGQVGHGETKRLFLDAWARRDEYPIHPVWLITGPKGIGKATLAYDLVARIFSDLTGRPADDIRTQMTAGGIGDLYIIDIEHSDSKTKTIPVDALRQMIEKMQMSSMAESWRVVVIDSVDELSRDAPNAILKTLEEPPKKTIFFLIAHSLDRVLPTIRSRARVEKLRPLSPMELREIASAILPEKEIGFGLIKISGGSFGKIAEMAVSGADSLFDDVVALMENVRSSSADMLALSKRIAKNPETISVLMDVIHHFGLADLYSQALTDIERMRIVNLEPELTIFKILNEIKKCFPFPRPSCSPGMTNTDTR